MAQHDSFNHIIKSISDFLYEEEANIDRKKIISVGTMLALAAIFMATDVFAKHGSHSSHSSHSSHVSGSGHSSHSSSYHTNHGSHESHESHESHASHESSYATHTSHASAVRNIYTAPTHSNSGAASIYDGTSGTAPNAIEPTEVPEGVIDIRIPLTPPDSPLMNGGND